MSVIFQQWAFTMT